MVQSKRWCYTATTIARNNTPGLESCILAMRVVVRSRRKLLLRCRSILSLRSCRSRIVLGDTPLLESISKSVALQVSGLTLFG